MMFVVRRLEKTGLKEGRKDGQKEIRGEGSKGSRKEGTQRCHPCASFHSLFLSLLQKAHDCR